MSRCRSGDGPIGAAAYLPTVVALACLWLAGATPAAAQSRRVTLASGGIDRSYYLYVPAAVVPATEVPLLVLLHGSGSDGRSMLHEWTTLANAEGIVLVAPNATSLVGWRIREDGPDFLREVVESVAAQVSINRRRVYLFGFSAGAVHALTIGAIESEYFAALALYAGSWRDRESFIALNFARRQIPVGFFIGDVDPLFSMKSVLSTKAAFEKAGHPVMLKVLPRQGHIYAAVSARVNREAWDFLRQVELAGPPTYRAYKLSRSRGPGAGTSQEAPLASASRRSRVCLALKPPPKPVSDRSEPMTRWQGTTIGHGFAPFAAPTARKAVGLPIRRASSPYETTSPNGILRSSAQTDCWNGVPVGASSTSNSRRSPRKYSSSCPISPRNAPREWRQPGSIDAGVVRDSK